MNNIFKKGFYIIAVLFLSIATSCNDDDIEITEISGLEFVVAKVNLEGTKVLIVPTTVNSSNRIVYTVDFGATTDDDTDVKETSGPPVDFTYPNEDGIYSITVTARLQGAADVSITKEVTIVEYIAPSIPTGNSIVGTWKIAYEAGAIAVGPGESTPGGWFSIEADKLAERACFFDDEYIFNEDGSFQNVLGLETWNESWQDASVGDGACGTPVFPHDGTAEAGYNYNEAAGTVTITGKGAFLGIAKAINGAELTAPSGAADEIIYNATLTGDVLELDILIDAANDAWWHFKLVREPVTIVGTWKIAYEAGAIAVGPGELTPGGWFSIEADKLAERACFFDDEYIFNEDGSFQNVLGLETWNESWQDASVGDGACGAPVFPHDGTAVATYAYNEGAGTVTITGKGAFLGIAKAINGAELTAPSGAADEIVYNATLTGRVLELDIQIDAANDAWWHFKLVKE
jgi:hypothetical protein